MKISRREFLKNAFRFLFIFGLSGNFLKFFSEVSQGFEESLKEVMFYKKLKNSLVKCGVCFRGCVIAQGKRGFCRNRENRKGCLYNVVYARPSAVHVDPVEKEPQHHMLPGTSILCFGTAGCNFRCKFCQNWHLSQRSIEEMEHCYDISPQRAVEIAIEKKVPTISFTYNEPTAFYEYVYDIARLAKEKGLKILFHSNGSMSPLALKELLKYTDSVTIDLKGFTEDFYQNTSQAMLSPVLTSLKIIKEEGKWLEIVNLVIPTLNDNLEDIRKMCLWIKENVGPDVPVHFSRFFPAYRLTHLSPTPIKTLEAAYAVAKDVGLNYVSVGNVPGHKYNSTYCPQCGKKIIERVHFTVLANHIDGGRCKFCRYPIPGLWK